MQNTWQLESRKKAFAELIGTFVLVFGGVGSAVLAGGTIGYLGISLAFGLSLLAMIYAVGPISGCHLNPAVTLGMWLCRRLTGAEAVQYVIGQIIGASIAAGMVALIAKGIPGGYDVGVAGLAANGYGVHSPGGYNLLSAFLAESFLTFVLVFTVLGATDKRAPVGFAGLAIGLTLAMTNLVAIPVTNASINPARSIGPAIFVGGWALAQLWVFVVAPLLGGGLAALVYGALQRAGVSVLGTKESRTDKVA